MIAFLQSSAGGMIAAALGFVGALVLWWASWRSINVRKAHLESAQVVPSKDPKLVAAGSFVLKELNDEQLKMLAGERALYVAGALLLAAGFAITFLRELASSLAVG